MDENRPRQHIKSADTVTEKCTHRKCGTCVFGREESILGEESTRMETIVICHTAYDPEAFRMARKITFDILMMIEYVIGEVFI